MALLQDIVASVLQDIVSAQYEADRLTVALAEEYDVLGDEGIVIIEAEKNTQLEESYGSMHIYKEKRYGISKLLYYRKETK